MIKTNFQRFALLISGISSQGETPISRISVFFTPSKIGITVAVACVLIVIIFIVAKKCCFNGHRERRKARLAPFSPSHTIENGEMIKVKGRTDSASTVSGPAPLPRNYQTPNKLNETQFLKEETFEIIPVKSKEKKQPPPPAVYMSSAPMPQQHYSASQRQYSAPQPQYYVQPQQSQYYQDPQTGYSQGPVYY